MMKRTLFYSLAAIFLGIGISLLLVEGFLRVQNFIELDGFAEKNIGHPVFHHGDGTFSVENFGFECEAEATKVLLLGDSWMEDAVLSQTLAEELSRETGECVRAVNGGKSSYSPTIYLLKAREAFKRYGRFDFIIVNIDETDIGDEWLRYRIPLNRDRTGKIIAVPFEEDIRGLFLKNGKLWAENSPSYIVRFLRFAFFYNVLVPYLNRFTFTPSRYDELMKYVFPSDGDSVYVKEQKYFYRRLREMVEGLSRLTHGTPFIYVTHHPHYRGLVEDPSQGKTYLPVVSELLEKLGREKDIKILDARDHVQEIHGEAFWKNTFEEDDPFSHLASKGAARYGAWIAETISEDR